MFDQRAQNTYYQHKKKLSKIRLSSISLLQKEMGKYTSHATCLEKHNNFVGWFGNITKKKRKEVKDRIKLLNIDEMPLNSHWCQLNCQ